MKHMRLWLVTIAMLLCGITLSAQTSYGDWMSDNAGADDSISSYTYQIGATAGSILTFDWEVSSEQNFDWIVVSIDGSEVVRQSGVQAGTYQHAFSEDGVYELTVSYTKDGSVSSNGDYAKISNISCDGWISTNGGQHGTTSTYSYVFDATAGNVLTFDWEVGSESNCDWLKITLNGAQIVHKSGAHSGEFQNILLADGTYTLVVEYSKDGSADANGDYAKVSNVFVGIASGDFGDNIEWRLSVDGMLRITGSGEVLAGYSGEYPWYDYRDQVQSVVIGDEVTSIGYDAFYGYYHLASVVFGNNVASIGNDAFGSCCLSSVFIPASVTCIESTAFRHNPISSISVDENNAVYNSYDNCNAVIKTDENCLVVGSSATVIPSNVTSIGDYAFSNRYALSSVDIPEGVTSIGSHAFYDCNNLEAVTIPEGVTRIGDYAFYSCDNLASIVIPENEEVGAEAFHYTEWYYQQPDGVLYLDNCALGYKGDMPENTALVIDEGTKRLANGAFRYFGNLVSVSIPEGVISVGESAFCECDALTTVTLPMGLEEIGACAFLNCDNLTTVTIPESVASIGSSAFANCNNLGFIYCAVEEPIEIDWTFSGFDYSTCVLTVPSASVAAYQSANYWNNFSNIVGVTGVGTHGTNLTWVLTEEGELRIMGDGDMESVDSDEYPWCEYRDQVQNIVISEGITSIGHWAFIDYNNLVSFTLPESMARIEHSAFYSCDNLTSIFIPASVEEIENQVFSYCSNLNSIVVDVDNAVYDSRENCNAIIKTDENRLIRGCFVTDIPADVAVIGNEAFSFCYALTSITLPESVTAIEGGAFSDCDALTSITLPESVAVIGYGAFSSCDALTSITIPANVVEIGGSVFSYCPSLSTIIVDDNNAVYDSPNNCNAIIKTDEGKLISGCVTTIIPDGVVSIDDNAFSGCRFTSINIPAGVTEIGHYAFSDCDALTSIVVPASVTKIGNGAFNWMDNLASITFMGAAPAETYSDWAFDGVDKELPIFVLDSSLAAYQTAERWNEFSNYRALATGLPEQVYLKNVATGKFLTGANAWGTRATLANRGVDMLLETLPNGRYNLETGVKNNETDHFLGANLYLDAPAVGWIIEEQSEGCYTLSVDGEEFIGFVDTTDVVNFLTDPTSSNAQWQLVTISEMIEELNYATKDNPVDATFYINGAGFIRNDLRNQNWVASDGVLTIGGDNENFCAEKWNSGTCTVSQALTGLPNGIYKLQAQAFYRMGGVGAAVALRDAGEEIYDVQLFANGENVLVMSVMDEAGKMDIGAEYGSYGKAPNTMGEASKYFSEGYYNNELYFTVTDGTATIGVDNNSGVELDWLVFDNFELYYLGSLALINDSRTSFFVSQDRYFETVVYDRNFTDTEWQTWYVPFDVDYDMLSTDFEVAYINDVHQFDDNEDGEIDRTEVEAIKMKNGVLDANFPYLIKAKTTGEKRIILTDAMVYATEENSIDCSSVYRNYTFTGSYTALSGYDLPQGEGYFTLNGGMWIPVSSNAVLGAFRVYMKIDARRGSTIPTQAIRLRIVGGNDEDDDVTGIENSEIKTQGSELIYDLQGRRVEKAEKGIYVVNGRKVLVK